MDAHPNFAYSTVATAPSPATSGTSLVVAAGQGARFGSTFPCNATVFQTGATAEQIASGGEIVRVTARSTDTLTITRAQEGTAARTIVVGDQIAVTVTPKSFTDIETLYATLASPALTGSPTAPTQTAKDNSTKLATTAYVDTTADGWIPDTDTWVFVSATSFKIVGANRTAKFPVGTKISYNDGGVDYGYVVSAAFSTDTTVTLATNDTYSIANATLTAPRYSYADNPQSFPEWLPYTVTYTGLTSPAATVARFSISGRTLFFSAYPAPSGGAAKNGAAASYAISLPVAMGASAQTSFLIAASFVNGATVNQPGFVFISASATTALIFRDFLQTNWANGTLSASFFAVVPYEI